ncbi:MAG: sulfotransferase [Proteobacteria bacterium]|nr:sulfotransferase [Pseudomonadota bacterium]
MAENQQLDPGQISSAAVATSEELAAMLQQALGLHQAGQLQGAEDIYQRILGRAANHPDTNYLLGTLYLQQGQNEKAALLLQKALDGTPGNATARINLGIALKGLGRFREAIDAYKAVLDQEPGNDAALNNLGVAHMGLDEAEEAETCFDRALRAQPDNVGAANNLGRAREALGDMEGAATAYRQAVKLMPDCGEAHLALASMGPVPDAHLQELQGLYDDPGADASQRLYLAFALGKALEDAGDYDKAFEYFSEGNRLHHAANPFDLANQAGYFSRLREIFTGAFMAGGEASDGKSAIPDAGEEPAPIFIVGMPRSGTSLVEQILASHGEVHGAGERPYLHDECRREAAAAGQDLPGAISAFDDAAFRRIAGGYLQHLKSQAPDARCITDKMPQNFLYVGLIARAFPGAKIIHCRRDPMDTCLSIYKRFFTSPNPWAYDLASLGGYYRLYEKMMAHWQALLPGRMFDIAYEDLVEDPETGIRGLLEHCNLPFDPACLEFHKTRRVVTTASAAQVRQPMYKGSVGAWKRYEKHLGPLREALK